MKSNSRMNSLSDTDAGQTSIAVAPKCCPTYGVFTLEVMDRHRGVVMGRRVS